MSKNQLKYRRYFRFDRKDVSHKNVQKTFFEIKIFFKYFSIHFSCFFNEIKLSHASNRFLLVKKKQHACWSLNLLRTNIHLLSIVFRVLKNEHNSLLFIFNHLWFTLFFHYRLNTNFNFIGKIMRLCF